MTSQLNITRNPAGPVRDSDRLVVRSLIALSAVFLMIALAEFLLNAPPILYILALTFSFMIMAACAAIKFGAGRDLVVTCVLIFSYIEAAVGLFAMGGLSSDFSLLVMLLPILSMFSRNPRTIVYTGVMTVILVCGLYAVNDLFFAHMDDPERPVSLLAAVTGLSVVAVTLILAGICQDTRCATNQAVAAVRQDLEAAKYSSLAKMAGCVAHEIANPLAILKGHVEVLMASIQAGRTDNVEARLASIDRTSGRLERLIRILASMGDPDRSYGPAPIAFSGIIADALTLLAATTEATGVRIEQNLTESPEKSWMKGNRALITSILFELTHASILVAKDSVSRLVRLDTKRTDAHITVTITTEHQMTVEEIDRITRTLNIGLMQLLTSSTGGMLTVTRDNHTYVQQLTLQVASHGN